MNVAPVDGATPESLEKSVSFYSRGGVFSMLLLDEVPQTSILMSSFFSAFVVLLNSSMKPASCFTIALPLHLQIQFLEKETETLRGNNKVIFS